MAITTAIEMYRGEDRQLNFTLASVTDITTWVIEFTIARQKNLTTKLIEKICDHTDQVNGVFQTVVEDADTADLQPGKYYWDAWRTDAGNAVLLGIGTFTILSDVREPVA